MPVRLGSLGEVQISDFDACFSPTTFNRGARYAREDRVLSLHWDEDEYTLSASVVGHGGIYSTTAYFEDDGDRIAFVEGECSCPVGINCKHVVAAVLAASASSGKTNQARPAAELTAYRQAPRDRRSRHQPRLRTPLHGSDHFVRCWPPGLRRRRVTRWRSSCALPPRAIPIMADRA